MSSVPKGCHTVNIIIIIIIVVCCQQLPLGNTPDILTSQRTHQQPPYILRSYLGLEPQRDRDGRDEGAGERVGFSPASLLPQEPGSPAPHSHAGEIPTPCVKH